MNLADLELELDYLGASVVFTKMNATDIITLEKDRYYIFINNDRTYTENELFFLIDKEIERIKFWKQFEIKNVINTIANVDDYLDELLIQRYKLRELVNDMIDLGAIKKHIVPNLIPEGLFNRVQSVKLNNNVGNLIDKNTTTVDIVATQIGMDKDYLKGIVECDKVIPYEYIYKLANALKCEIKDLYERS